MERELKMKLPLIESSFLLQKWWKISYIPLFGTLPKGWRWRRSRNRPNRRESQTNFSQQINTSFNGKKELIYCLLYLIYRYIVKWRKETRSRRWSLGQRRAQTTQSKQYRVKKVWKSTCEEWIRKIETDCTGMTAVTVLLLVRRGAVGSWQWQTGTGKCRIR